MKKRSILIVFILFFIVYCFSFFSKTEAVEILPKEIVYLTTSQYKIEVGQEVEITVKIEDTKTAAFNFSLFFDTSMLEFIASSHMENTSINHEKIKYVWFDEKGGEGAKEGNLVTFRFKGKEQGIASFRIEGEFYDSNRQLIQTSFKEKQIQIGSLESELEKQAQEEPEIQRDDIQLEEKSNANLYTLRLDKEGLTPVFEKQIYDYYLTIPTNIQNLEVLAISENPKAKIEITGNTNLQEGLNRILIRVISEDGTQNKVYTILVTKTNQVELANTNLEILAIENVFLNPVFDVSQTIYKAEVANGTEALNVLAIPENEKAMVQITGKENLQEGKNLIIVLVTAQNGFSTKKYEIEVYRRNKEEEKQFQEEEQKKIEELANAYPIEETSLDLETWQEQATNQQNKKYQGAVILCIVLVILCLIGFIARKFHKK